MQTAHGAHEPVAQPHRGAAQPPVEGEEIRIQHVGVLDLDGTEGHEVQALPLHLGQAALEVVGEPEVVVGHVGDEGSGGRGQDPIAMDVPVAHGLGEPIETDAGIIERPHRRFGGVVAAVADDVEDEVPPALGQHRPDGVGEGVGPPVGGEDDVDGRRALRAHHSGVGGKR